MPHRPQHTATVTYGEETATTSYEVNVINYKIESVKQTKTNTFEAIIIGKTSELQAQDLVITNTETKAVKAVQSISVDGSDAEKVTFTTYADLTDGKTYTASAAGSNTVEFDVTDGTVDDVTVSTQTITAGTSGTEVKAQLLDKNDVIIAEYGINDDLPGTVDYSITTANGYIQDNKLVLPEVDDTATAEIVYHTFDYDTAGNETGKIEKTFTITAIADTSTTEDFNYTLTTDSYVDWTSSVATNAELAVNDEYNAFFYFKDSNGSDVTTNYTVESSDTSVLLLANTNLTNTAAVYGGSDAVTVTGVKAGTAYINVLDGNGKTVTSLPVTVKAARKLTNISFGKSTLYSSNESSVNLYDKTTITGYDQYGDVRALDTDKITGTILSAPSAETTYIKGKAVNNGDLYNNGLIGMRVAGCESGKYVLQVSACDEEGNYVTKTLTINAVDTTNGTTTYELEMSSESVDLAVSSSETTNTYGGIVLTAKVVEKINGAPVKLLTKDDDKMNVTMSGPSNVTMTENAGEWSADLTTVSGVGKVTKEVNVGAYKVTAEFEIDDKSYEMTKALTVTDSQEAATADVKQTTNLTTSADSYNDTEEAAKAVLEVSGVAVFYYDGQEQSNVTIEDAKDSKMNGKALYIGTVYINVKTNGGLTITVPVVINRTFTLAD